jgi:hypothetical protein
MQLFTDFRLRERVRPRAIQPYVHANLASLTGQIQPPPDNESDEDLIEPKQS